VKLAIAYRPVAEADPQREQVAQIAAREFGWANPIRRRRERHRRRPRAGAGGAQMGCHFAAISDVVSRPDTSQVRATTAFKRLFGGFPRPSTYV
jgi:hypothetical protein